MSDDDNFFLAKEIPPAKRKEVLRAIAIQKSGMMPHVNSVEFELEDAGYEVHRFIIDREVSVISSEPPVFVIPLMSEEFTQFQKVYSLSSKWNMLEIEGWAIGDLFFFHLVLKHSTLLKSLTTFCFTNSLPAGWDIPKEGVTIHFEDNIDKRRITMVGHG
ncbi:MAG: hypothetical protein ACFFC7_27005 [Candidatus Hermodarchaeota archaeon]